MIGRKKIFLERVTSTNDVALEQIKSGKAVHGTVIFAGEQSNGRGQQGNKWISGLNKNLIISIILSPKSLPASSQFIISKIVSVALVNLLSEYTKGISIKWPNDIYAGNDKIAGILIEHSIKGDKLESSVVGIGLNLNQSTFSGDLPNPVSLGMITGIEYNRETILNKLCRHIDSLYMMVDKGIFNPVDTAYHTHLYRRGTYCDYRVNGLAIKGRIEGVDQFGRLFLEDEGGAIKAYSFKEIEFIL
ncbi:MAG: biotin--[acetyl-CoA-carboxylase] ligase [Bacteroidales bacterium]|nr:biotin--[acetyl-CoA-carboxylase] ligase [Bacteroidales bacterium]